MLWGKKRLWGQKAPTDITRLFWFLHGDSLSVEESHRMTLAPWSFTPSGKDIRFEGRTGYTPPSYNNILFDALFIRIFVGDHMGTTRESHVPPSVEIETEDLLTLDELVSMILRENSHFETERGDSLAFLDEGLVKAAFSRYDEARFGEYKFLFAALRSKDPVKIDEAVRQFIRNVEIPYTVRHRRGSWGTGVWGRRRAGDLHWWTENYLRWGKPYGFVSGKMERYKR